MLFDMIGRNVFLIYFHFFNFWNLFNFGNCFSFFIFLTNIIFRNIIEICFGLILDKWKQRNSFLDLILPNNLLIFLSHLDRSSFLFINQSNLKLHWNTRFLMNPFFLSKFISFRGNNFFIFNFLLKKLFLLRGKSFWSSECFSIFISQIFNWLIYFLSFDFITKENFSFFQILFINFFRLLMFHLWWIERVFTCLDIILMRRNFIINCLNLRILKSRTLYNDSHYIQI